MRVESKMWKRTGIQSAQRGFTLIEVMVVIVILGVLAAMVVPAVMGQNDKARAGVTNVALSTTGGALDMFKLDNGRYPTMQEGLDALVHKPANVKAWPSTGYVKGGEIPKDGWDHDLQYVVPGTNGKPYDLYSWGADGKDGGEGVDADIYYTKQ